MANKSAKAVSGNPKAAGRETKLALWTPQPGPQANAIAADWCPLIFYGGGKFSGKSDFLLGDYLQDLATYREHWQGIIFRRSLTEFTELKLRANELFPKIGGKWQEQKSQWVFPNFGNKDQCAILRFRYLENLRDIRFYEGHSYPWIGVDELGDWEDPTAFFRLFTMNRYGRFPIPNKRIRATGNPGGRGHQWIKKYFVDPAPLGSKILFDDELKIKYMFILGTYRDNRIGIMNDPDVPNRMNRAGSKALVKALKDGDFSVVSGAFFEFEKKHIIPPFQIPVYWNRIVSMDWGACGEGDPFSIGWWAVSDGTTANDTIPYYRRGDMIRYREWYGKGLPRVAVSQVASGILEREKFDPKINYRVAGGDIKKKADASGPSVFEMFSDSGINWVRADMDRVSGWLLMRERLLGQGEQPDNVPNIYVFSTCVDSIAVIPAIQHAMTDANDIEQSGDDIADEWRYGIKSRPWAADAPLKELPMIEKFHTPTLNDMWDLKDQMERVVRR